MATGGQVLVISSSYILWFVSGGQEDYGLLGGRGIPREKGETGEVCGLHVVTVHNMCE